MAYIYKITNTIKGYIYIGQTIDLNRRYSHYKNNHAKAQKKIYNSINKYGWDNHNFEVLERCEKELLNDREIYWIEFYNSYYINNINGLNLTIGGTNVKNGEFQSKIIYQYDFEGNFIKSYPSGYQIKRELGFSPGNISNCCVGKVLHTHGYRWFHDYKGDKIESFIIPPRLTNSKAIVQLDGSGNIVAEYASTAEAERLMGLCVEQIVKYLKGTIKRKSKKYDFKYKE